MTNMETSGPTPLPSNDTHENPLNISAFLHSAAPVISDELSEKHFGELGAFRADNGQYIASAKTMDDLEKKLNELKVEDYTYSLCSIP